MWFGKYELLKHFNIKFLILNSDLEVIGMGRVLLNKTFGTVSYQIWTKSIE